MIKRTYAASGEVQLGKLSKPFSDIVSVKSWFSRSRQAWTDIIDDQKYKVLSQANEQFSEEKLQKKDINVLILYFARV